MNYFKNFNKMILSCVLCISLSVLTISSQTQAAMPQFQQIILNPVGANNANGMGGGVAWIDCNNDGWQDLYAVHRAIENQLFINNQDGGFSLSLTSGAENSNGSHGVAVGDFNNDGNDDIFVANDGQNSMYINNGNCQFTDQASVLGLDNSPLQDYVASAGDVDGDGDLDLFVGSWNAGAGEVVYFRNMLIETNQTGFQKTPLGITKASIFGLVLTDFDNDNDLDLYVVADFMIGNAMLVNEGNDANGNPNMIEDTTRGTNIDTLGMGVAAGDYNLDGKTDYFSTTISVPNASELSRINLLLTNDGSNNFINTSLSAGVVGDEGVMVENSVYWGCVFFDADNDGYPDLYAANDNKTFSGSAATPSTSAARAWRNRLYMNNQDATFTDKSIESSSALFPGLGVALADYDKDGRADLAVSGYAGELVLLHNVTVPDGNGWLAIRLKGSTSNRRGIGAKVRVTTTNINGTTTQTQEVSAGSSHASSHSFELHFGIAAGSIIDKVSIDWPSGQFQEVTNIVPNQTIELSESTFTTIKEITSRSTVIVGALKADNAIEVKTSNFENAAFNVGASSTNFMQALPVLQSNNRIDVSITNPLTVTSASNPKLGVLSNEQIGLLTFLANDGMVFASANGSSGYLLPTPTQAVMAATALANGNQVSYTTFGAVPVFDSEGNFITNYPAGIIASTFNLKN